MRNEKWEMRNEKWEMRNGKWEMRNGKWEMGKWGNGLDMNEKWGGTRWEPTYPPPLLGYESQRLLCLLGFLGSSLAWLSGFGGLLFGGGSGHFLAEEMLFVVVLDVFAH